MAAADVLVLPSRFDGWGAVVNEALMVGTPVICSDRCGASDVIENGRNGYVDTRIERLVDVMRQLQHEPALAAQWSEAARATALERFSIERFAADWDRVLRAACAA